MQESSWNTDNVLESYVQYKFIQLVTRAIVLGNIEFVIIKEKYFFYELNNLFWLGETSSQLLLLILDKDFFTCLEQYKNNNVEIE